MNKLFPSRLRYTFLAHAIAMGILSTIYMFFPVWWGNVTGCLSSQVPAVYRLWGLTILGYAVISLLAFRAESWVEVKIVAQMERIITTLFPLGLLLVLVVWDFPAIAWMPFVIMSGFAVAFNIFYPKAEL